MASPIPVPTRSTLNPRKTTEEVSLGVCGKVQGIEKVRQCFVKHIYAAADKVEREAEQAGIALEEPKRERHQLDVSARFDLQSTIIQHLESREFSVDDTDDTAQSARARYCGEMLDVVEQQIVGNELVNLEQVFAQVQQKLQNRFDAYIKHLPLKKEQFSMYNFEDPRNIAKALDKIEYGYILKEMEKLADDHLARKSNLTPETRMAYKPLMSFRLTHQLIEEEDLTGKFPMSSKRTEEAFYKVQLDNIVSISIYFSSPLIKNGIPYLIKNNFTPHDPNSVVRALSYFRRDNR